KPADPGPPRPVPVVQPAAAASAARGVPPRPTARVPSLIERVTGIGRARPPAAAAQRPPRPATAATARPAAQPRLAPLEPEAQPGASKEDDLLDIPAFLRRQGK